MLGTLKTLCALPGASGREDAVRAFLIERIKSHAEYEVDALGNLLVHKKGAERAKRRVMLAAHMDEVALIVTYITEEGYLRFAPVGGIDPSVLFGRGVLVGTKQAPGVIGSLPVHLLEKEALKKMPDTDQLYIDIGAASSEEAQEVVHLGDIAYFDSAFVPFGERRIKAKALDDRAGCAILLEMIESDLPYDLEFAFTVQEEVGLRGAGAAAYQLAPDYAIVVETTTAADLAGVQPHKRVCALGRGAVVSFMDKSTLYDRRLYDFAFSLAERKNIRCQTKTLVAGGNDAGAIHKSRGGVKTITVSVPCRYLHSPCCVIEEGDLYDTADLVRALAQSFANDSVD
ncbi:MAG TPA: M42 family metallopeptidase [Candidatus Fimivicinus intestinavium]|nr:M42 family metallopeptidase [Candidatus Fimivicinus intestinavium]